MKPTLLAVFAAFFLSASLPASAQALGEAIHLNQQSMQNPGTTHIQVSEPSAASADADVEDQQRIIIGGIPVRPLPQCNCASEPIISLIPGTRHSVPRIELSSSSPDAKIYYTTDGWTPTTDSTLYTKPITIGPGTQLQAIAFEPDKTPSAIATASMPLHGVPPAKVWRVQAPGGTIHKGTKLRLITTDDVTSDTAEVGDPLLLMMDQYIVDGATVIIPRRTPVRGTITRVVPAGRNGKPGVLSFQIHQIRYGNATIPISVNLTLAAPNPATQSERIADTSAVHVARAFAHGQEAEIVPHMPVIVTVTADTALRP